MKPKAPQLSKGASAFVFAFTLTVTVLPPLGLALILGKTDLNLTDDEWGALAAQVLIVAAPFGVLWLSGIKGRRPWLVAAGLTLALWSLLWLDAVVRRGDGGANIGLGLLMLVSPVIVVLGALLSIATANE